MEDGGVDTIVTESREYLLPFIFSVLTFMKYTVTKLQMPHDVTCKYAAIKFNHDKRTKYKIQISSGKRKDWVSNLV